MTTYEQGEVVLVPFPFTDQPYGSHPTSDKRRPAVVISTKAINSSGQDIVLAAITSNPAYIVSTEKEDEFHLLGQDQIDAGLSMDSAIKLSKIVTAQKRIIIRKLGKLSPETTQKIIEKFKKIF